MICPKIVKIFVYNSGGSTLTPLNGVFGASGMSDKYTPDMAVESGLARCYVGTRSGSVWSYSLLFVFLEQLAILQDRLHNLPSG